MRGRSYYTKEEVGEESGESECECIIQLDWSNNGSWLPRRRSCRLLPMLVLTKFLTLGLFTIPSYVIPSEKIRTMTCSVKDVKEYPYCNSGLQKMSGK